MSASRLVTFMAGFVLASAAAMLIACSGGDSGPPSVSSFHYVETVTGNIDGDPLNSREEGWYQAPDSAHIMSNVGSSALGRENIVIGSQVWERRDSGWSASTANVDCNHALVSIKGLLRYGGKHDESAETGDGPPTGGEPTELYKWTYEDAGRFILSYEELRHGDSDSPITRDLLAREKEIFSDLTGTTEVLVGKNTRRVYSLVFTRDGPKLSDRRETVVDQYDQPVDIQPPLNVPPAADGNASAGCLELGDDFPWIPAAIAAVLGPLLFLAASAFVWPRRL